jgi:hypothetical protein
LGAIGWIGATGVVRIAEGIGLTAEIELMARSSAVAVLRP